MTEKELSTLVINKIDSASTFERMKSAGQVNEDELYLIGGDGTGGVTGVKGSAEDSYRTGQVSISKANIGLGNVDNTSDADKPVSTATQTALDKKVDKVSGKGLSTNDYTTAEKNKLSGIASNANNYSLPVASTTALGGVKSGTDITIDTSGNVSVNDDSHNHIISNVDGLQTALDNKVAKETGKGLSTNDLTATLKSNYDAAYTHSTSAHAPSNAERNTIVGVQQNGTDLTINSSTRKVNVTVPTKTSDLTNDSGYLTEHQSLSGLATESYVDTKVAGIVNSAPETLDTLNELAEALGNDPNFATTMATELGKKVDKVTGKGLSTNDYTTTEKSKLAGIATNANNYSLPVASTTLGGVKSGTDITVDSSGNVSVNDNSHAHTIANVSGLQSALDGKVAAVSGKGLSTNDLTATLKSNYDAAYTHSTSAHAPSNAERNVIVGVTVNGVATTVNSSTRKVDIETPTQISDLDDGADVVMTTRDAEFDMNVGLYFGTAGTDANAMQIWNGAIIGAYSDENIISGFKVLVEEPTENLQAASKSYVDSAVAGVNVSLDFATTDEIDAICSATVQNATDLTY